MVCRDLGRQRLAARGRSLAHQDAAKGLAPRLRPLNSRRLRGAGERVNRLCGLVFDPRSEGMAVDLKPRVVALLPRSPCFLMGMAARPGSPWAVGRRTTLWATRIEMVCLALVGCQHRPPSIHEACRLSRLLRKKCTTEKSMTRKVVAPPHFG